AVRWRSSRPAHRPDLHSFPTRRSSDLTVLTISNLVKSFAGDGRSAAGRVFAVNDVSLEVGEGEMFTLLGPSGCGKTTTLRSVARSEEHTSELQSRENLVCRLLLEKKNR